jgi:uncharacterized protein (TIGR03435 family)
MRFKTLIASASLVLATPLFVFGQEPEARPQFEVASVKPNTSGLPGFGVNVQPGGRFVATNVPLNQLIRLAYTLQLFQIVDAPGWVASERFDVNAVTDRDITVTAPWTPGSRYLLPQLMVQALLADRFKMVAHTETREAPVFALVIADASRGPAEPLRSPAVDCGAECGMRIGQGTLRARGVPMRQLAEFLSQVTGRLVTDATGLSDRYDLDLRWSPDPQAAVDDAPSIFTAVQEQLGLRLEARRGPIPVLVIDSIERPTPD